MTSVLISFQVSCNLQQPYRQTPGWVFQQYQDKTTSSEIRTGEIEKFPFLREKKKRKEKEFVLILILKSQNTDGSVVYLLEVHVIVGKNLTS